MRKPIQKLFPFNRAAQLALILKYLHNCQPLLFSPIVWKVLKRACMYVLRFPQNSLSLNFRSQEGMHTIMNLRKGRCVAQTKKGWIQNCMACPFRQTSGVFNWPPRPGGSIILRELLFGFFQGTTMHSHRTRNAFSFNYNQDEFASWSSFLPRKFRLKSVGN